MADFTEMRIFRLVLDRATSAPIVLLKDEETGAVLPIWIGLFEAHAIATKLENVSSPRPMTHDLMQSILRELGAALERIKIVELRDGTYYASLEVKLGEKRVLIDARPSDAMALALRTESPVFVNNNVLEVAAIHPTEDWEPIRGARGDSDEEMIEESEDERWNRILSNLKTDGSEPIN